MSHNYTFRKFKNYLFFVLCALCVVIAAIPLFSILTEVIVRGAPQLSIGFVTQTRAFDGIGPAIQGTLILIFLTSLIGLPIGILAGIFLAEYSNSRFANWLRPINDVIAQNPSIVVGITVYAVVVLAIIGSYSVIAGAIALSFILIPIVTRTTEESLKLVPTTVREASMALGVYKWRTTLSIVIPTGLKGVITGALIAIARIAGETAPLIMTILGSRYFFQNLASPMNALPLEIYRDSTQPYTNVQAMGWGAALVLILIVLVLNILVRLATRKKT